MLRATQAGIAVRDLELMTVGMVIDMLTAAADDDYDWPVLATQEDMDAF